MEKRTCFSFKDLEEFFKENKFTVEKIKGHSGINMDAYLNAFKHEVETGKDVMPEYHKIHITIIEYLDSKRRISSFFLDPNIYDMQDILDCEDSAWNVSAILLSYGLEKEAVRESIMSLIETDNKRKILKNLEE